ncbi:MAG: hypothetical protein U0457_00880 [Candidatus Sericytochromatia bacterium]
MDNNEKTPLMKLFIILERLIFPTQIILLKYLYNFDTILSLIIALPYLMKLLFMQIKIDYANNNIELILKKIENLEQTIKNK